MDVVGWARISRKWVGPLHTQQFCHTVRCFFHYHNNCNDRMKNIRSTTTVVAVLAVVFAHVVVVATAAAPRTATTTRQKVSTGRGRGTARSTLLRGGGGRRRSEDLLSRKLRRHDVNHPIDRQYMVFLKPPSAEEAEGRRTDDGTKQPPTTQRRSSLAERWSHRRVLQTHTNDKTTDDHGPLRAVTLQGLTDQDLLDLIDDDEVAFVEQVSDCYVPYRSLVTREAAP
jgi:hypothetical protein